MVGESDQNVFLIQIDASSFAEFEISEFEVSIVDCMFILQVIVGVHDSRSIFKLKKKVPIDGTSKRMANVKKFADIVSYFN